MSKHDRMFHHEHAHKLDDPDRKKWLPVDEVIQRLALRNGMNVADVGAGTGYFALPIARAVAPLGHVYAVDLQLEMLDLLRARLEPELSILLVHGEATRTTLEPSSVDLVFFANIWHELDERPAALVEATRVLRPGGRVAILDWRPDVEPSLGPPLDHRVAAADVVATLADSGWTVEAPQFVGQFSYLIVATAK